MSGADQLREEAQRLRDRAEDLHDDNPTAAEYHDRRASWCDYLARQREKEDPTD
jgi:hypothetical protein